MKVRHAFSGYVYEDIGDGLVKVVDPEKGVEGVFDAEANWQSGDLNYADYHMCRALGGPKAAVQSFGAGS
jgi:hypothetical protein